MPASARMRTRRIHFALVAGVAVAAMAVVAGVWISTLADFLGGR